MDKEQANSAANVLMDIERTNRPTRARRAVTPPHQRTVSSGSLIGFGLGMLAGGLLLDNIFPASLVGTVLGALTGRYVAPRFMKPKA